MPANTSSCKLLKQASPLNFGGSAGTKFLELKNRLSPAAKSSFCDTEASQSEAAAAKTEEEGAAKKAYDSACDNYELNMKAEQFGACLHCGKLKKDHPQASAMSTFVLCCMHTDGIGHRHPRRPSPSRRRSSRLPRKRLGQLVRCASGCRMELCRSSTMLRPHRAVYGLTGSRKAALESTAKVAVRMRL